jgi:hypothetical protein
MRRPSIHLNGSDPRSLFDAYRKAKEAVQAAIVAVAACAPNGRDYYIQQATPGVGQDPINEAMSEHRQRLQWLRNVENDMETLAHHVLEATEGRLKP